MDHIKKLLEDMQTLSVNVRHFMHKQIASLELDVTYEMVKVLFILSEHKELNQQQIADMTLKNKASLTSLIDNMQKRDLVIRTEDAADRRNKIITMTEQGQSTLEAVKPVLKNLFQDLYQDISLAEIKMMNNVILKMSKVID